MKKNRTGFMYVHFLWANILGVPKLQCGIVEGRPKFQKIQPFHTIWLPGNLTTCQNANFPFNPALTQKGGFKQTKIFKNQTRIPFIYYVCIHYLIHLMTTLFDDDGVAGGYFCALLATVFFGSFAVPIKTPAIVRANVDPVAVR